MNMDHMEDIKKIKEMLGDFLGEIAEEKRVSGSNVATIKEAISAYQKICELCEDEDGSYGARRDSRGRYMAGGNRGNSGMYGWMPGPYYSGGNYGADNAALAANLEQMASSGNGSEGMATALREAARWLRQS